MPRGKPIQPTATLVALAVLSITAARPAAADWPTHRGDGQRSGITSEGLELPLAEAWIHRAAPPCPAWPEMPARKDVFRNVKYGPTVVFDRAPHVVAEGERVYFGSSADDTVY